MYIPNNVGFEIFSVNLKKSEKLALECTLYTSLYHTSYNIWQQF